MTSTSTREDHLAYFLGLGEIAAWQLESPVPVQPCKRNDHLRPICAELPALQRGAVWGAAQTEALWDSLVRGFPIGAFFFVPYQDGFGRGEFKLGEGCGNKNHQPDYLLLDGQQRATAIALGFLDLWKDANHHPDGPALWVDLEPVGGEGDERNFVFRLLTRSHPWGYGRNDPKKSLAHGDIRDALKCFREVGGVKETAAKLNLRFAWPWDAMCPVPVSLLLSCAGDADWKNKLETRLRDLPMWNENAKLKGDGSRNLSKCWGELFDDRPVESVSRCSTRLAALVDALSKELLTARIPALVLPPDEADKGDEQATDTRKDAVETLFIRVNSAGTPIVGEELIYSSLKAAWPSAPQVLKKLQPEKRQIVTPARLVTLLWRLYAAFPDENGPPSKKLPGTPTVAEFRKAIRKNGSKGFQSFVERQDNQDLFVEMLDWVRLGAAVQSGGIAHLSPGINEHWRLPPTLAAQLFAGEKGLDTLFIAAAWVKCLHRSGRTLTNLTARQRQRSLGFIVSFNWFTERSGDCISRLWTQLQEGSKSGTDFLGDFFDKPRFRSLLPTRPDGGLVMLPIIPPDVLDGTINRRASQCDDWTPGSRWEHFYERLAPPAFSSLDPGLRDWLLSLDSNNLGGENVEHPENAGDESSDDSKERAREEALRQTWSRLLDKMWTLHPLIDYAQREWLDRWFPNHDPTLPGQMEDINRPWDYDHIHPSALVVNNIPAVIREWHRSIGNLRAWPLELNRGDHDDPPAKKLFMADEQMDQLAQFGIVTNRDILRASFIGESSELDNWQASVPTPLKPRYLAQADSTLQRQALLRAITQRFCKIYREWYESLALGDL